MKQKYMIRDYDGSAGANAAAHYIQNKAGARITTEELTRLGRHVLTVVLLLLSVPVAYSLYLFFSAK